MTTVKLAIGANESGVCTSVPKLLWELGDTPTDCAVVFSDKKPKHVTGVYRFTGDDESIRVYGVANTPELREWIDPGKPPIFWLTSRTRNQLWGLYENEFSRYTPKKGYVWAEEI